MSRSSRKQNNMQMGEGPGSAAPHVSECDL